MSETVRVIIDIDVRDMERLTALAQAAEEESTGERALSYEPAEAFALAFNDANRAADAVACLDGWSASPADGWPALQDPPA